jgi:hypothetical protein
VNNAWRPHPSRRTGIRDPAGIKGHLKRPGSPGGVVEAHDEGGSIHLICILVTPWDSTVCSRKIPDRDSLPPSCLVAVSLLHLKMVQSTINVLRSAEARPTRPDTASLHCPPGTPSTVSRKCCPCVANISRQFSAFSSCSSYVSHSGGGVRLRSVLQQKASSKDAFSRKPTHQSPPPPLLQVTTTAPRRQSRTRWAEREGITYRFTVSESPITVRDLFGRVIATFVWSQLPGRFQIPF